MPVDSRGSTLAIGELIAQGGEGGVYRIPGNTAVVAKLYHQPPSADRVAKLRAMVAGSSPEILRLTCWPTEIIAERPSGPVKGFLMPSAGGNKEAHKLYSPKSRSVEFQNVDWGFLIQAAANIARAFAVVHRDGHVIGDVNHSSVMIAQDATVKLIDCDSFQVQANGERFLCEVAEPLHTPPELQGKALRGLVRTPNHDNFGLAVLIFELLFMGRHPFAGMYLGQGDLALEQKIERCLFAYGLKAQSRQMRQPPNTLALEAVSPEVASMFEVAFADFSVTGVRPPAADWIRALVKLQGSLKRCASDVSHFAWNGLSSCPWCEIEAKTGVTLFTVAFAPTASGTGFNLALLWEGIRKLPVPPEAPPPSADRLPELAAAPMYVEAGRVSAEARRRVKKAKLQAVVLFVIVLAASSAVPPLVPLGLVVGTVLWAVLVARAKKDLARAMEDSEALRLAAANALALATSHFEDIKRQWLATTSPLPFRNLLAELQRKKIQYEGLQSRRQEALTKLRSSLSERQLAAYLDRFEIKPGQISSIGLGRCVTLAAYGIETAADVTYQAVIAVPGFGDATAKKVVAWANDKVKGFRFDPSKGIDPKDLRKLEADFHAEQRRLEAEMLAGKVQLIQISSRVQNARSSLSEPVELALKNLAIARANAKTL